MIELNHVHILVAISTCLHTFPNSLPMNSTCISSEQRKLIRVTLPHLFAILGSCHMLSWTFMDLHNKTTSQFTHSQLQTPKLPPRIPVPVALARWPCRHAHTTRRPVIMTSHVPKAFQSRSDQKLGELSRVIWVINHKAKSYNYISHNSLNVFLKTCVFSRCGDRTCKVFKDQGGTCVKYSKSQGFPMHVRLTAICWRM